VYVAAEMNYQRRPIVRPYSFIHPGAYAYDFRSGALDFLRRPAPECETESRKGEDRRREFYSFDRIGHKRLTLCAPDARGKLYPAPRRLRNTEISIERAVCMV
jgi:hypothetical protein